MSVKRQKYHDLKDGRLKKNDEKTKKVPSLKTEFEIVVFAF